MISPNKPIVKKFVAPLRNFGGFDNFEDDDRLITHYIKIKDYIRDKQTPCLYHRFNFYSEIKHKTLGKDNGLNLSFINCGHGDSCLVEHKGKYILIDFGGKPDAVKSFLDTNLVGKTIEYAICSHFHSDHMTDYETIFKNYNVENFVFVKNINTKISVGSFREVMKLEFCNANRLHMLEIGDCLQTHPHNFCIGDLTFEILGPTYDFENLNDNSVVVKLSYKDTTVLFTGDISDNAEKQLMNYCKANDIDLGTNILKVAHHGSKSATCIEFLQKTKPDISIVCCSEKNKYYHPDYQTIKRLETICPNVLQTKNYENAINICISPDGKITEVGEIPEYSNVEQVVAIHPVLMNALEFEGDYVH